VQETTDTREIAHKRLVPGEPAGADLDGDKILEEVLLDPRDRSLSITDGAVSYHSRDKWRVSQALLGDTDHNGLTEVVALLDSDEGRHLGLFAYFGGEYRERLVTQAISPPPLAIDIVHYDQVRENADDPAAAVTDGDVILLVQEPATGRTAPRLTLLRWNSFSFTRIETATDP
jgi:hypothetical protein